jgi:hypothetical protein
MPKKGELAIHVLLDTNSVFTEGPFLVNSQTKDLIADSKSAAYEVIWYMADTVRGERRYRMARKAIELFSSVRRLESLIDQKSGLTAQSIQASIDATIEKQIKTLGFSESISVASYEL